MFELKTRGFEGVIWAFLGVSVIGVHCLAVGHVPLRVFPRRNGAP